MAAVRDDSISENGKKESHGKNIFGGRPIKMMIWIRMFHMWQKEMQ